ncbi:hypothetical protein [Micromonospora sp. WMMD737]|uniref:hypothetical protein n=1 Tax=Micromonospora sp. WMMD737 TaxID=3404113 RepID=UPI003B93612F
MARLKTYTAGINTHVHRDIFNLLEQPDHIRQARVLIVATTKAAAIAFPASIGSRWVGTPYASEVRVASGSDVDALAAAGLLDAPAVFVMPNGGFPGTGVVRVDADGFVKRVGRMVRTNGVAEFEPEGTVTVRVTPAARERLAAHLHMQSTAPMDECRRHAAAILAVLEGN